MTTAEQEKHMGRRYTQDNSDDGYDRLKDEYLEGTGRAYNERTRREEREERDNDKWNGGW
jgi:hypothetical protein